MADTSLVRAPHFPFLLTERFLSHRPPDLVISCQIRERAGRFNYCSETQSFKRSASHFRDNSFRYYFFYSRSDRGRDGFKFSKVPKPKESPHCYLFPSQLRFTLIKNGTAMLRKITQTSQSYSVSITDQFLPEDNSRLSLRDDLIALINPRVEEERFHTCQTRASPVLL